jgi:hypothetical protein
MIREVKMKKILSFMIILMVSISLLAFGIGCKETAVETAAETAAETEAETAAEAEAETTAEAAAEAVTITVPRILGWVTTDAVIPAIAEELAKDNINIEVIDLEFGTFRNKQMMEATQGTDAYDIYLASDSVMPIMPDYLEPLDSYLVEAGIDIEEFKSRFYPNVVDLMSNDKGELIWIPMHINCQIGYARTDLFTSADEQAAFKTQYGYDLPVPDATGLIEFKDKDQFLDVAKFFTRDDLWGFVPPGKWDHGGCFFEELMYRAGLEYFTPEGHSKWGPTASEETKAAVEAIVTFTSGLVQDAKVSPEGILGMEMTEVNNIFKEGKAAMTFTWNVDFWGENNKPEVMKAWGDTMPSSWSVSFMDTVPENMGPMSIWSFGLNKNSANKEAAIKFLLLAADDAMRKSIHEAAGLPCGNGSVEITPWLVEKGYAPGVFTAAIKDVGSWWPTTDAFPETELCRDVVRENHEKVLSGEITPAQFVEITGTAIEAIMQEAGYF